MKKLTFILIASLFLVSSAFANTFTGGSSDKSFVENAAQAGVAEVKYGELGKLKATHPDVKAFAERLISDHSKANAELKSIVASKRLTAPEVPSFAEQRHYISLEKLSGAEFDREFVKHMVECHEDAVEEFEKQAKSGKDAELTKFARDTLPTLQEHLSVSRDLKTKLGT